MTRRMKLMITLSTMILSELMKPLPARIAGVGHRRDHKEHIYGVHKIHKVAASYDGATTECKAFNSNNMIATKNKVETP